jgi:hypothetical protein
MGVWKNVFLVFISIFLVVALIFLGVFSSLHAFLYPQIYEKVLSDNHAYDSINVSGLQGGSFIKIPANGISGIVNPLIENTLSYLRGDSPALNLTLQIDTQKLNDFFLQSVNELSPCKVGENPFNGTEPVCRPAEINSSEFLAQVLRARNFTITPDEKVNLANLFGLKKSDTTKVRNYVMDYEYVLYGLFALVIALSFLMFFMSETRTRWSGIDFLVAGVAVFVLGYLFFPLVSSMIPNEISFVSSVSKELADYLYSRIQIYSLIIAGIGIAGIVVSFFIKKKISGETAKPQNKKV